MLTDEATIRVIAGKGGDGLVSFRREKYVPKGGPDGGSGGKGGDVYFIADNRFHSLAELARKKQWRAQNGQNGKPKRQTGKNGQDLEIFVPPGTIIKDLKNPPEKIICDLTKENQKILVARGGRGGWGNYRFATATSQSPAFARDGDKGEERHLDLELKLIAEIGLIGLPNAGKSTLLSRISRARPKIAAYPFTTLEPNLGVVKIDSQELIVADIPGLIEGSSKGKGLGDKFLRHIERTKILVHLIDINSDDIGRDYKIIREELKNWNPLLLEKKEIVVLTKADTMTKLASQKIADRLKAEIGKNIFAISAVSGEGIEKLLRIFIE